MDQQTSLFLVQKHFGGIVLSIEEGEAGCWIVVLKPGKFLVSEVATPEGNIRIKSVNFEEKEITVVVSDAD